MREEQSFALGAAGVVFRLGQMCAVFLPINVRMEHMRHHWRGCRNDYAIFF